MLNNDEAVNGLDTLVSNLIRVGVVSAVIPADMTARVIFGDQENTVSYDMQVLTRNSAKNKDYWLPDVGEEVVCLFLPSGIEAGFILGAYYPASVARPETSPDVRTVHFADGSVVQYDRAAHKLTVIVESGDVEVRATNTVTVQCTSATVKANSSITLDTPITSCTGNLSVAGSMSVAGAGGGTSSITGGLNVNSGDVKADNISLKGHGHIEQGDGARTSNAVS